MQIFGLSKFDFEWQGADALSVCVGYVRGVERAASVIGEELGYKK